MARSEPSTGQPSQPADTAAQLLCREPRASPSAGPTCLQSHCAKLSVMGSTNLCLTGGGTSLATPGLGALCSLVKTRFNPCSGTKTLATSCSAKKKKGTGKNMQREAWAEPLLLHFHLVKVLQTKQERPARRKHKIKRGTPARGAGGLGGWEMEAPSGAGTDRCKLS